MYQYSYNEIVADSSAGARAQEREAFDHAIGLLHAASVAAPRGPEALEAITFTTRLWGLLIKDLAQPGNDLPDAVRASLMSIGLWVLGQAARIEAGESDDMDGIAAVCVLIRDGLN